MTVAAVRTDVATLVAAVSGVHNVLEEDPHGTDTATAKEQRVHDGRVHFWLVKAAAGAPDFGLGYHENRHVVTVECYLGLATDDPQDDVSSRVTAANLQASVMNHLSKPANVCLATGAEDRATITAGPISRTRVQVGHARHHALRFTITASYMETVTP